MRTGSSSPACAGSGDLGSGGSGGCHAGGTAAFLAAGTAAAAASAAADGSAAATAPPDAAAAAVAPAAREPGAEFCHAAASAAAVSGTSRRASMRRAAISHSRMTAAESRWSSSCCFICGQVTGTDADEYRMVSGMGVLPLLKSCKAPCQQSILQTGPSHLLDEVWRQILGIHPRHVLHHAAQQQCAPVKELCAHSQHRCIERRL